MFHVKIEPDTDAFTIDMSSTYPTITLTQPAEQGRANAELLRHLSRLLDADVHIVSGHKRRRKKLSADLDRDTLQARLSAHQPD